MNSLAHFWTVQAFLPGMQALGRGNIVTIASALGILGCSGVVDYCASKHAAVGFTEALHFELRKQGYSGMVIRVSATLKNNRNSTSWLFSRAYACTSRHLTLPYCPPLDIHTTCVCPGLVQTKLFQGVFIRWPLLIPPLTPKYLAGRVLEAVRCNQTLLATPRIGYAVPLLRALLPGATFDELVEWLGASEGMDTFRGRNEREP